MRAVLNPDNYTIYVYEDFEMVTAAAPADLERAHDGYITQSPLSAYKVIDRTLEDLGYLRASNWEYKKPTNVLTAEVTPDDRRWLPV